MNTTLTCQKACTKRPTSTRPDAACLPLVHDFVWRLVLAEDVVELDAHVVALQHGRGDAAAVRLCIAADSWLYRADLLHCCRAACWMLRGSTPWCVPLQGGLARRITNQPERLSPMRLRSRATTAAARLPTHAACAPLRFTFVERTAPTSSMRALSFCLLMGCAPTSRSAFIAFAQNTLVVTSCVNSNARFIAKKCYRAKNVDLFDAQTAVLQPAGARFGLAVALCQVPPNTLADGPPMAAYTKEPFD